MPTVSVVAVTNKRDGQQLLTKGVDPQITVFYKSSRLKQYFKEGRALRT